MESLTDYELSALQGVYNLADGHAYHLLSEILPAAAVSLEQLWDECQQVSVPEVEHRFLTAFADLAASPALAACHSYRIAPTASNSIDIVGALLVGRGLITALVEPTFDNLSLLLKRRGVRIQPLPETSLTEALRSGETERWLDGHEFGALFLVDPNNPTGTTLTGEDLEVIASYCAQRRQILVLDHSFRFFKRASFDDYRVLQDSGVSFVSFEDTGKVWPTHDLKASLIVSSPDLAAVVEEIYNEIYLCHSRLALAILEACLKETSRVGLEGSVWQGVDRRRDLLRESLTDSSLYIDPSAEDSELSVEWLNCSNTGMNDLQLTRYLEEHDVMVLPGRPFYWDSADRPGSQSNIRVAMFKPMGNFRRSVARLTELCSTAAIR